MSANTMVRGNCNCGKIKVSISEAAFPNYCSLCHCLNCRSSSGSLFAVNLPCSREDVIIDGEQKVYHDVGGSGNGVDRYFCDTCGSAIMSIMATKPDIVFLKSGIFAKLGFPLPAPGLQLWWRRAEKWEHPVQDVKLID